MGKNDLIDCKQLSNINHFSVQSIQSHFQFRINGISASPRDEQQIAHMPASADTRRATKIEIKWRGRGKAHFQFEHLMTFQTNEPQIVSKRNNHKNINHTRFVVFS